MPNLFSMNAELISTRNAAPPAYEASRVTTAQEREQIFAVRMTVFVEEQNVPPEEELDALDLTATHFLARLASVPPNDTHSIVGTARLIDKGEGVGKIGRVAVLREHRGRGVGNLLMQQIERYALEQNYAQLILEAQCQAIPFYEKLGYTAEGGVFLDAGIAHRLMRKTLTGENDC